MYSHRFLRFVLWLFALASAGLAGAQTPAVLIYDASKPAVGFGARDLKTALEKAGFTVTQALPSQAATLAAPVQVVIAINGSIAGQPPVAGLAREGYAVRRDAGGRLWLIGHDASGAMYAALDAADSVTIDRSLGRVTDKLVNARLEVRGFKFNIPLDDRTPTYTDETPSAQFNYTQMWSLDYWKRFLDQMARSRLNSLSLWNKHPFPHLVKLPDTYPKVALADVYGKQGLLNGGSDTGKKVLLESMTIDQKIQHWRDVMQYAQDRGVAVSFFTWNVKVDGTEASGYGFEDGDHRPQNTRDYMRQSVRALINTYPLLAGVGATAGESFDFTDDNAVKEQWMWDTYGLGYQDAVADMRNPSSPYYRPGRKVKFFHRAHEVDVPSIVNQFSKLPGYDEADSSLNFTYKYSQAHMHSSTKPLFISRWINNVPAGKKVTMEVRNDDFFNLRWGDPDFARAYLSNFPEKANGFLMGPDGYIWGREVVSKNPDSPRQQTIDKAWYAFMLWGYLAYDRGVPNERFKALLDARYPQVPNGSLYTGLAAASKVWPLITRFFWGSLDFKWYPEASWSNDDKVPRGYQGVQAFITPSFQPMTEQQDGDRPLLMSVKDFVDGKNVAGRMTPLDVAAQLEANADVAMSNVASLNGGSDKDLNETIGDVKALAWLGRYYADKILGAVELYRYQKNTSDTAALAAARTHLQNSANHWRQYAAQWDSQYIRQYVPRVGAMIDMKAIQAKVDADIPGGGVNPPPPPPSSDAFDVTALVLVNAANGAPIRALAANDTLSLAKLGAAKVSIQAIANTGAKSVKFVSAQAGVNRTEGSAPWSFLGNSGNTYTAWNPTPKTYTITASGYSAGGASGTAGKSITVTIHVTP